jgi:hypothetical protein
MMRHDRSLDQRSLNLPRRSLEIQEAIRQSIAKPWVKERYAPPVGDAPSELGELLKRLDAQP